MILGRSTPQWVALITSTVGFAQLVIINLFPDADAGQVSAIGGGLTVVLGAWVAFLANTSTTPTKDPELQVGTMVRATDPTTGVVVGHVPVPAPQNDPLADDGLDA